MPERSRDVFETGQEPAYTIDEFARVEMLRDGTVRIYVASEWRGGLKVEYSVRVTKEKLATLARECLMIAADTHNRDEIHSGVSPAAH